MVRNWGVTCLLVLMACEASNHCPNGSRSSRDHDRCFTMLEGDGAPAVAQPDAEEPDEGAFGDVEAEDDASTPDPDSESSMEAGAAPASGDAGMDADLVDGNLDGSDASLPPDSHSVDSSDSTACSSEGVERWAAKHREPGAGNLITGCARACDAGIECADQCVRTVTGIQGCGACTIREAECVGRWCGNACSPPRSDQVCVACLCQADCIREFELCAGSSMSLCGNAAFLSDAAVGKAPLSQPVLLLGRSSTGTIRASRFETVAKQLGADVDVTTLPMGQVRFIGLPIPGREIVLHYSAQCAAPPCSVRGFLMLEDGTFGAPVFEERWDPDFIDIESFAIGPTVYLARLRKGASADQESELLVDRIEWDAVRLQMRLVSAARLLVSSPSRQRYVVLEPLVVGGDTLLFMHAPTTGESQFLRVVESGAGVNVSAQGNPLFLDKGWDLWEAFKSFGTWYLFSFKTGDTPTTGDRELYARIWKVVPGTGGSLQLESAYEDQWGYEKGLSHVQSWMDAFGQAYLLFHNASAGVTIVDDMDIDPKNWWEGIRSPLQHQMRPDPPRWDIVHVVRQGQW